MLLNSKENTPVLSGRGSLLRDELVRQPVDERDVSPEELPFLDVMVRRDGLPFID